MLEIALKINELLRNGLPPKSIKQYYEGTPVGADTILTPSIATEVKNVNIKLGATGMDRLQFTAYITFYFDKKRGMSNQKTKGSPSPIPQVDSLLFGVDMTGTYAEYSDTSIIGILRKHLFLSGDTLNTQANEIVYNSDIDCERIDDEEDPVYIFRITFVGLMNVIVLTRS